MTGAKALELAVSRLRAAGVADPARDARILLVSALGIERSRLTLVVTDDLLPATQIAYEALITSRADRQPVSQIIGYREFFGRKFKVTTDVLDPRPDTERLIEAALDKPFGRVLDLGTGSGCILLTLLAECPDATGLGVDTSSAALAVARANAKTLKLDERAVFAPSDWFAGVEGCFDLIVANPPYISAAEMNGLEPEVRNWEPRIALTPEGDGLDAYRAITKDVGRFLGKGGRVLLEIGPTQGRAVISMLQAHGFATCRVLQDLDGRDRVVEAT